MLQESGVYHTLIMHTKGTNLIQQSNTNVTCKEQSNQNRLPLPKLRLVLLKGAGLPNTCSIHGATLAQVQHALTLRLPLTIIAT